jgi:hypothetical protein
MTLEEQLDEIMDHFDFRRVALMMEAVGWKWERIDCTPSESDLRARARQLLKEVCHSTYRGVGTGGFLAQRILDEDEGDYLKLSWGIDWEATAGTETTET